MEPGYAKLIANMKCKAVIYVTSEQLSCRSRCKPLAAQQLAFSATWRTAHGSATSFICVPGYWCR